MLLQKDYSAFFFIFIIFAILTLFLNPNFSFSHDTIKHWSTYNRDDIVFVYGTLIYNEGLEQQHLDHPSLFTFIFTSLFYKIFYIFGFLDHYTLSGFISSEEDVNISLSKLFFVSKVTILLFSILTLFFLYKILLFLSLNKKNSFLLTCLFIFSTGFISSSNRLESGLISLFLILVSIYFFLKFANSKNKIGIIFFSLGLVFLFSSMMQKKIIYFCIPFLLLSLIPILKKNNFLYLEYKSLNRFLNYKILLALFYLAVLIFISYKTLINNTFFLSRDLDFIFLILNYSGLNLILFLYIKYFQERKYSNLLTYNIILGVTYFIFKYILIFFLSAHVAIWSISFTNFMGHLNMFAQGDIKGALEFSSLNIYFQYFLNHINIVFKKYFFTISFQSILLWSNFLLFLFFFKNIELKKKIVIIFLLFGFLLVQSIILFRYEQDTYFLNSEILLFLSLIYLMEYLRLNIGIIIALVIVILSTNITMVKSLKYQNSVGYCKNILKDEKYSDYYSYWTKNIPLKLVDNFCKDLL